MRPYEATGRTVEEAIGAALAESGLSIGDVNVQILDEGSKGLFGLFGSRMARVRLVPRAEETVSDTREMFRDSLREKPSRQEPTPRDERPAKPAETPRPPKPEREAAPSPEPTPARPPRQRAPQPDRAESAAPKAPSVPALPQRAPGSAGGGRVGPREGQGRRRPPQGAQDAQGGQSRPSRQAKTRPQIENSAADEGMDGNVGAFVLPAALVPKNLVEVPEPQADSPEQIARDYLREMTRLMGMDVQVAMSRDEDGHIYARMDGDPQGILIGRRGETLDAMQYLTSLMVNRGREEYVRVTLDSEGYRKKREEALVRLATRMANRARKTGRRVAMEPMNPYERRIFHSALQSIPGIATHSEGEEPNRHVVITPVEASGDAAQNPAVAENPD